VLKGAEAVNKAIPFSGSGALEHETRDAIQSAIARDFGENAHKLTPSVIQRAQTRIGGVLNDVESRYSPLLDNDTLNDLARVESAASSSLGSDSRFNVVKNLLNGVIRNVQPGDTISGTTYGNLIHKGSPIGDAIEHGDPAVSSFARQIRDTLRGALERTLSGEDLAAYKEARRQYKSLKTIEPLTQQADVAGGASPSTGDINLNNLRHAVNQSYGDVARRAPGDIPLNDLADIAQRFLKPEGHSSKGGHLLAAAAGGGALYHGLPTSIHEAATLAAGAGGALTIGRALNAALHSGGLADRTIANTLGGTVAPGAISQGARLAIPEAAPSSRKPSVNPRTGLPEFSLEAARQATAPIAAQMREGKIKTPEEMRSYLAANKHDIRKAVGGQGLQNISFVHAMTRRPANIFATISANPSPAVDQAMKEAGINDTHDLLSLAMASPELAKILAATNSTAALSKAAQTRLIAGIQQATKGNDGGPVLDDRPVLRGDIRGGERPRNLVSDATVSQP